MPSGNGKLVDVHDAAGKVDDADGCDLRPQPQSGNRAHFVPETLRNLLLLLPLFGAAIKIGLDVGDRTGQMLVVVAMTHAGVAFYWIW